MSAESERVDAALRNDVGRTFAFVVGLGALWTKDGPFPELREYVGARVGERLRSDQVLLLRVALDFYDGSGGLRLVDVFRELGTPSRGALESGLFLAEFVAALAGQPDELVHWVAAHGPPDEDTGALQ